MASDYSAARQEFVDKINAGVSLGIPFIQKRVNLGKNAINEESRSNGVITLFVPAGGTGGVEALTDGNGPIANALDRTNDTDKANSSYYKVECHAHNGWELVQRTALEKIFQIGKIRENIVQPRINHMVHSINRDLVTRNVFKAGGVCIAGSSELGFIAMDKAIATLESVKATGSWTGFVSPLLKSRLGTGAAKKNGGFDVPDEVLKDIYGKRSIGVFAGTDWVNEPFLPKFKTGALNATDTASNDVKVSAAVRKQGATEIAISGLTSGTIKAGTPFTIEGVYDVTITGLKMDWLKTFVVQNDVAVESSGATTVEVLPIYFNDDTKGYQNNVFVAGSEISANAVVKGLAVANGSYDIAFIKEDEAFNWTPFSLEDVDGAVNTTSETEDISVQLVSGGNLLKRTNMMRLDSPYFGDIVDPRLCRLVYVQE